MFGKILEYNPKQLGLPSEFFQKAEFFSIWARQHDKILSGTVGKVFQSNAWDTTDRSSGGSRSNDNITRLYHHWPGSIPEDSGTQLVGTTTTAILPYQEGDSIYDVEAHTEVISNSDSMKTNTNNGTAHAREVLMVRRPRSPLNPPEAPDVRSSDESESNISPFAQGYDGETENQRQDRKSVV